MKKEIINCLTWYANKVAETVEYTSWSDEFCRKEIKKSNNDFVDFLKKYIDFGHLTKEEAMELGFLGWSDKRPDLYLIPLYLVPIIPIGTELIDIFGKKIIYNGKNIDNDVRFGCIAYGIEIKEKEKENENERNNEN